MNKKIKIPREVMWLIGMILMPFAVTLCTKANLGMSMIAAPTYIVSQKFPITYGQAEWIFQAIVLALMCIIVRKFKVTYLTSFVSAVIYGAILDFFVWVMRDVELKLLWVRIIFLILGMVLTALAVAMLMFTYLAPCAYDYLVRTVVEEKHCDLRKFKLGNDFAYLVLSLALTFILFKSLVGIYWGTILMVALNGNIISFFAKKIEKYIDLYDLFPKLAAKFE